MGRPEPDAPVQGEGRATARAGVRGPLLLPGVAGGRRPGLSRHRGPRGRRSAPAHRAHAGHRRALQLALWRGARRPGGNLPGGRGPDHEPPGSGDPHVHDLWVRAGHRLHPRRGRRGPQEASQRRHRLGDGHPPRPRQGRDHEPDRDHVGRAGSRAGGPGGRVRRPGLRRLQGSGRRGGGGLPGAGPRALRGAAGRRGGNRADAGGGGREGTRDRGRDHGRCSRRDVHRPPRNSP